MFKKGIPFDYFSLPIRGFNFRGQESSKTWLGFICTLGLFGAVMALFISDLVSMFRREGLTVSTAEEGVSDPLPTNLKNSIIVFSVTNRASPLTSLTYGVDFNIQAEMLTWNKDEGPTGFNFQPLTIQQCDAAYFGTMASEVEKKVDINNLFCIPRSQSDELLTIQGQMGSTIFKEIHVKIYCGAVGATSCPPTFKTSNILFMYGASYLDASNYEDPVSLTPTAFVDRADVASYHEKIIRVTPRDIITDKGLIFSDPQVQSDIIISEGPTIVEGINLFIPEVFRLRIQMSSNKITVNRTYQTIFDVLASATGIASTITLVIVFVLAPYIDQKTHEDVMKTISPDTCAQVKFRDYLKALFGVKDSKEKLEKVEQEKEWITQNMDMIQMINNWSDFEKMKRIALVGEQVELQDIQDTGLLSVEKKRSFFRGSMFHGQIHPESPITVIEQ